MQLLQFPQVYYVIMGDGIYNQELEGWGSRRKSLYLDMDHTMKELKNPWSSTYLVSRKCRFSHIDIDIYLRPTK